METGHPSTRAVNSGSGNRALVSTNSQNVASTSWRSNCSLAFSSWLLQHSRRELSNWVSSSPMRDLTADSWLSDRSRSDARNMASGVGSSDPVMSWTASGGVYNNDIILLLQTAPVHIHINAVLWHTDKQHKPEWHSLQCKPPQKPKNSTFKIVKFDFKSRIQMQIGQKM